MGKSYRVPAAVSFLLFGSGLAMVLWGTMGLAEFGILARAASLTRTQYCAFLSETVFYYSLSGALFFLIPGALAAAILGSRRSWRGHISDWGFGIALGLAAAEELFFSRAESLFPPGPAGPGSNPLFSRIVWGLYCLLLAGTIFFLAQVLKKRLGDRFRPVFWKWIYLSLSAVFLIQMLFYLTVRPWRWLESTGEAVKPSTASLPNVLLITIDALRADHLPAYGYHQAQTPNLDRAASEAIIFQNAYSQSDWTFPSIAALFTSRDPDALYPCRPYLTGLEPDFKERIRKPLPPELLEGVLRSLEPNSITLAGILSGSGYRTGAVVSNWFNSSLLGIAQGFSSFTSSQELVSQLGPIRRLLLYHLPFPDLFSMLGRVYSWYQYGHLGVNPESSLFLNQKAEAFLQKNRRNNFFLWVHYIEPHIPYGDEWALPVPAKAGYSGKLQPGFNDNYLVAAGDLSLSPEDVSYLEYLYDHDLAFLDRQIGGLFEFLRERQLWEKTIIIISADHGEQFMEHGHLGHGFNLYQEDIRVPLLIKLAGKSEPRMVPEPVQLLDLGPTILDLLGLPIPAIFEGKSLKPLLEGKPGLGDENIYSACNLFGEPSYSLRKNNHLLVYYAFSGRAELYDLSSDPENKSDLSAQSPELSGRMLEELKQMILNHQAEREKNRAGETKIKLRPEDVEKLRALGYVK